MKLKDTFTFSKEANIPKILDSLRESGYEGVVSARDPYTVVIVKVPDTRYLVQAWSQENTQHVYSGTLEEADEAAQIMLEVGYEYAEICEGYPGEWTPVKKIRKEGRR